MRVRHLRRTGRPRTPPLRRSTARILAPPRKPAHKRSLNFDDPTPSPGGIEELASIHRETVVL